MDRSYFIDNANLMDKDRFSKQDLHLAQLLSLEYIWKPAILKNFPAYSPGIYTLTGGGLTGKTTLLKQWIMQLFDQGVSPENILFISGALIENYHELTDFLQTKLSLMNSEVNASTIQYVLIDDVTDVRDWDKAIKFLNAENKLKNVVLMLSSGDVSLIETVAACGNENIKGKNNFHLAPLSFREIVTLKYPGEQFENINLYAEFNQYLLHGGYLPAINDMVKHGKILDSTLKKYSDWLRREITKHGKKELFLYEVLTSIVKHYNKPNTWNLLAKEVSINHPKTVAEYVILLEALDAVFVQSALLEDTLKPAPKKARKLLLNDPFIFHAVRSWINPMENNFVGQIKPAIADPNLCSNLVHGCVTTLYKRCYPTYYIKAEGEIDVAYLDNRDQGFTPVLVSWNNDLRPKDLKQLLKYSVGKILTKTMQSGMIEHIRTEPLPRALCKLIDNQHYLRSRK